MLSAGDTVIVAVSGGTDSMVLLQILLRLAPESSLKLVVAHLNHNLRGAESEADLEFVSSEAARMGLKFYAKTLGEGELRRSGVSLQNAARRARYEFFEEAATRFKACRVAVAHNLDDRAETMLMRIIEGTGLKGLSSIPPLRGPYIRPLIDVNRREIEAYAASEGVSFREDSSNKKTDYLRNRLRKELIPLIEEGYNPLVKVALTALAGRLTMDGDFIEGEALKLYASIVKDKGDGQLTFPRGALIAAHPALSSRVFFIAAEALRGISGGLYATHAEAFLSLVNGERPNASIDLPNGLKAVREYEDIRLFITDGVTEETAAEVAGGKDTELKAPGVTELKGFTSAAITSRIITGGSELPGGGEGECAVFDYDAIGDRPLIVRRFRPGDRMRPLGLGGTKKLKDIFVDMKIPLRIRKNIPIVVAGGDIIWIAGLRRSEAFPVTERAARVLVLTLHADEKFSDALAASPGGGSSPEES